MDPPGGADQACGGPAGASAPRVNRTRATHRDDGAGQPRDVLVWRFEQPMRAISSGVAGGGLGPCRWVLNAEVALSYRRRDPEKHLNEIASELKLASPGVGLLTAARVSDVASVNDAGVRCDATVGLSFPLWPAAPIDPSETAVRWQPGTINLVCVLPGPMSDAGLVGAVITATEAKTQALLDADVPGTGTASDAIVICCPEAPAEHPAELFCGPRSLVGGSLARAVHGAVGIATARWLARHG